VQQIGIEFSSITHPCLNGYFKLFSPAKLLLTFFDILQSSPQ